MWFRVTFLCHMWLLWSFAPGININCCQCQCVWYLMRLMLVSYSRSPVFLFSNTGIRAEKSRPIRRGSKMLTILCFQSKKQKTHLTLQASDGFIFDLKSPDAARFHVSKILQSIPVVAHAYGESRRFCSCTGLHLWQIATVGMVVECVANGTCFWMVHVTSAINFF